MSNRLLIIMPRTRLGGSGDNNRNGRFMEPHLILRARQLPGRR